ncbi:equilibrative nucleotide transporter 3-like isoform X4 [Salvia divinorum]|uniref:Equilibrative nucleotide transporter 3-like isoform X4 n=1 Tax=Salvia divinorum TaxID=28513 RepID=A0ABD1I5E3_SALDI
MTGDLFFMPPHLIQSFLARLSASGALVAGLRLVTKAVFDQTNNGLKKGVILFLAISIFDEFLSLRVRVSADLASARIKTADGENVDDDRLSNKQLLLQNIDYALDIYLLRVLTLSIFPGFLYIPYDRVHKVGVKKGSYIRVLVAFLAHSLFLFHGQLPREAIRHQSR